MRHAPDSTAVLVSGVAVFAFIAISRLAARPSGVFLVSSRQDRRTRMNLRKERLEKWALVALGAILGAAARWAFDLLKK